MSHEPSGDHDSVLAQPTISSSSLTMAIEPSSGTAGVIVIQRWSFRLNSLPGFVRRRNKEVIDSRSRERASAVRMVQVIVLGSSLA